MVKTRLHLICGNCGNDDKDLFYAEYYEGDELTEPTIYVKCNNCGTVHDLADNSTIEKFVSEKEEQE